MTAEKEKFTHWFDNKSYNDSAQVGEEHALSGEMNRNLQVSILTEMVKHCTSQCGQGVNISKFLEGEEEWTGKLLTWH
jgi:hypothetical protein